MTLIKYHRRFPVVSLTDDMDRLFDLYCSQPLGHGALRGDQNLVPAFDIREGENQIVFETALPGLEKKEIDITLKDGVLTVTAERKQRDASEDETIHRTELRYGKFQRSFTLPEGVSEQDIDARHKNGLLTITVQKPVLAEPEKHSISVK